MTSIAHSSSIPVKIPSVSAPSSNRLPTNSETQKKKRNRNKSQKAASEKAPAASTAPDGQIKQLQEEMAKLKLQLNQQKSQAKASKKEKEEAIKKPETRDQSTSTEDLSTEIMRKRPIVEIHAGRYAYHEVILNEPNYMKQGAFCASVDGKLLAKASRNTFAGAHEIRVYRQIENQMKWKLIKTFKGNAALIKSLTFSEDSQSLISGGEDGAVRLWSLSSESEKTSKILEQHKNPVFYVTISPDKQSLLSVTYEKSPNIPFFSGLSSAHSFKTHLKKIASLDQSRPSILCNKDWGMGFDEPVFLPHSTWFATIEEDGLGLRSLAHPNRRAILLKTEENTFVESHIFLAQDAAPLKMASSIVPSPDGKWLATVGFDLPSTTYSILIWKVGDLSQQSSTHQQSIYPFHRISHYLTHIPHLVFSPDSQLLASADKEGRVFIWSTEYGVGVGEMPLPVDNNVRLMSWHRSSLLIHTEEGIHQMLILPENKTRPPHSSSAPISTTLVA